MFSNYSKPKTKQLRSLSTKALVVASLPLFMLACGSEPAELRQCKAIAEQWLAVIGYDDQQLLERAQGIRVELRPQLSAALGARSGWVACDYALAKPNSTQPQALVPSQVEIGKLVIHKPSDLQQLLEGEPPIIPVQGAGGHNH